MTETISVEEFRERQQSEDLLVVDTRGEESFEGWRLPDSVNYPYKPGEEVEKAEFQSATGATEDETIVTICAIGRSSYAFADELTKLGYGDVAVLDGGMAAYSGAYDVTTVPTIDDSVEVVQLQRRAKGCLGYVVSCTETKQAAVIDATRQTDEFREAAEGAGYEVVAVFDTHVHADHVSGGRALADELGVPYYLGERAAEDREVDYEYEPLARNTVVEVGEVDLKALYTPGHTSESVSYLVNAAAVLTGDTLFVESVGRTELQFSGEEAVGGAESLYDTLHGTLLAEPDPVTVCPGHFPVADDGSTPITPGEPVAATVGERRQSAGLLQDDRETFVAEITDDLPEKPPNYERVIAVNTGRESLDDEKEAVELELGPNRCAAEE
ncbi:rhodanese-like domain-containing protein [Haloarchaeobius sp. HME9146]|uniref:MBL fold metallo-hydrolase n=1 Tax=Haloarchaeobius sp. HME9146 TaxID=2978732 RepID=UPI0021C0A88C|nr:rhodanese-like domain-containing protein [Haloarchaeobius sp. HME9146]MCT9097311.1 rhodanese-like domain-containing protein [Haloarchaeobius sp. HME9146]